MWMRNTLKHLISLSEMNNYLMLWKFMKLGWYNSTDRKRKKNCRREDK